jgi:ABC-2 type transport system permease protein
VTDGPARPADGGAGPSVTVEGEPTFARVCGLIGGVCAIIGGVCLGMAAAGKLVALGPGWASLLLVVGLAGLLFHAHSDKDAQFRLVYLVVAAGFFLGGVLLCLLPYPAWFSQFGYGWLGMFLGLLFVLAVLRHETDATLRQGAEYALLGAGALAAALGIVVSEFYAPFFLPMGLLLATLGLLYLGAFVAVRGVSDDLAYRVGLGLAAVAGLLLVVTLVRAFLPSSAGAFAQSLTPYGVVFLFIAVAYGLAALFICSDNRIVVMTRRELGAYFYSPIAYFVLFGFTVLGWLGYFSFVGTLLARKSALVEPIVANFAIAWPPVFCMVFIVPALTMRLLSEEKRSGTLEVLLTTPVNEAAVVLSKFFAAFLMFLTVWVPFGLYLVALRVIGGQEFDFRPLLSFFVALCLSGAMFVSMGLFFSSLTRNQIVSAVLTFGAMLLLTFTYFMKLLVGQFTETPPGEDNAWVLVLRHVSYIDLWIETMKGKIELKYLLFPASMTVLWLFLTGKVLEARKWT